MHLTRLVCLSLLAAAMLSLDAAAAAKNLAPPSQHNAAGFFRTREQLTYFEVYHTDSRGLYRTLVSLESLLAAKPDDYVRIDSGNSEAVGDLYHALADTVTDQASACKGDNVDVRWAIVLNYRDQTRDAIGIGQPYSCVKVLSRETPVVVASDTLLKYVKRNFPFMH